MPLAGSVARRGFTCHSKSFAEREVKCTRYVLISSDPNGVTDDSIMVGGSLSFKFPGVVPFATQDDFLVVL